MGERIDLTGQRFGAWTVLGEARKKDKSSDYLWNCVCDCGESREVSGCSLRRGGSSSCGCLRRRDITGKSFGKLTALRSIGKNSFGKILWECSCECGNLCDVASNALITGNTKSCGCGTTKIDLTGKRFGMWTVTKEIVERRKVDGSVMWDCTCDCGAQKQLSTNVLRTGDSKSCGCSNINNIVGKKFGRLLVVRYEDTPTSDLGHVCTCICDCGKEKQILQNSLVTGKTKSCGCLRVENMKAKKGSDHYNYNPNLTDEQRLKNRYRMSDGDFSVWSKMVKERDNYTCQICGDNKGGKLNSHHINAWNAFPEQRFDLDNGVTLCVDCHKEFHKMYGRGGNTREQFDEYAASKTLVLN